MLHFMLHDGHVVFVTMKEKMSNYCSTNLVSLNDFVKYEKGFNYFWAKKVVTIHKSNADVTFVRWICLSSIRSNIFNLQQNTSPLSGLSTNTIYLLVIMESKYTRLESINTQEIIDGAMISEDIACI